MDSSRNKRRGRIPRRFLKFPRLPLELQTRILELACPGPRLIEVYPRPRGWNFCDEVVGYEWRAHKFECEQNCHSPLVISQVCRNSRRIFKRMQGKYRRCFGTYINWENDILYIGDRTGHLHNTEFLKTVELAGGLGKVKNLAIHEDVWSETKKRHGNQRQEFKRCGPVGVVQQLGIGHLTIVSEAGFFRDGTEFWNEVDERDWLWNSDTEADDYDEYMARVEESEEESGNDEVEVPQARHAGNVSQNNTLTTPISVQLAGASSGQAQRLGQVQAQGNFPAPSTHNTHVTATESANQSGNQTQADVGPGIVHPGPELSAPTSPVASSPSSSIESYDIEDSWACDAPVLRGEEPRAYKPRSFDSKLEEHRIPSGDSGLALVDFSSIPGNPLWVNGSRTFRDVPSIKAPYLADFEEIKEPHAQHYSEDEDPDSDEY